ncbi:MAG: hypothetical protein AAFP20_00875 [Cyanobacteria bacterium J06614_10]
MIKPISELLGLSFSGVPSNLVYDGIKKVYRTLTSKDLEALLLDSFKEVIEEEKDRLLKFTADDGTVALDFESLSEILHADISDNVDGLSYSKLTSEEKLSALGKAMSEKSVLIMGGHSLTTEEYTTLSSKLLQLVKARFKDAIIKNQDTYNKVLLDETLASREVFEETSQYLKAQLGLDIQDIKKQVHQISDLIAESNSTGLDAEYQAQLDHVRDLINGRNPKQSLDLITKIEPRLRRSGGKEAKHRLAHYKGLSFLGLGESKKAAKCFIGALQFNEGEDSALYYSALGHLLLGQLEQSRRTLDVLIEKNPSYEKAYSLLIQVEHEREFDELVNMVPEPYRDSVNVSYTLGCMAQEQLRLDEASHWFEVALRSDKENTPNIRIAIANLILEEFEGKQVVFQTQQVEDSDQQNIRRALQLLEEAWSAIEGTDTASVKPEIIMMKGVANMLLSQNEQAILDIDQALRINPQHPVFKRNRAALAIEAGDHTLAVSLLSSLLFSPEVPDAAIALAEVLRREKRYEEAKATISSFLDRLPPAPLREQARRTLVQICVEAEDTQSLANIYNNTQPEESKTISDYLLLAIIARVLRQKEDALRYLSEARQLLNGTTISQEAIEIAENYHAMEEYEAAVSIYKNFVDTSLDTRIARNYIDCLYRSGQFGYVVEICKSFRSIHGISQFIFNTELSIYHHTNNLNAAKQLCIEYLAKFPDNQTVRLDLALTNYRMRCFEKVDEFLASDFSVKGLSLEVSLQAANLFAFRERFIHFFDILYRVRQEFPNDPRTHVGYSIRFMEHSQHPAAKSLLQHSTVKIDSAVCLIDSLGKESWHILVDDSAPDDPYRKEVHSSNILHQKLIGKQTGDKIVFRDTGFSREEKTISLVVSKYVYAYWDSLDLIEKRFPDAEGVWPVPVAPEDFENGLPQSLEAVLDSRAKSLQFAESYYKQPGIPIGLFAKLVDENLLVTRSTLVQKPDLGIKCCLGIHQERMQAIELVAGKEVELIIDLVTLVTIYDIGVADAIVEAFGLLGVAQSTVDLLHQRIEQDKSRLTQESSVLRKEGDQIIMQTVLPVELEQNINYLERLLVWIDEHCQILPCDRLLSQNAERRQKSEEFEKLVGVSFAETALIASEDGRILYSDDMVYRQLSQSQIGVAGIWTQEILRECQKRTLLDSTQYSDSLLKLVALNYQYVSIDDDVLIEAARQAEWLNRHPFEGLLRYLGSDQNRTLIIAGDSLEQDAIISSIDVLASFIYKLWKQDISTLRRDEIVLAAVSALLKGRRNHSLILKRLDVKLRECFYWLPIDYRYLSNLIRFRPSTYVRLL